MPISQRWLTRKVEVRCQMNVRGADPRDVSSELEPDRFRVTSWVSQDGSWIEETADLRDCDIGQVLEWIGRQPPTPYRELDVLIWVRGALTAVKCMGQAPPEITSS